MIDSTLLGCGNVVARVFGIFARLLSIFSVHIFVGFMNGDL